MPIHDWTRVSAGTWHAFHSSWISEIQLALNGGLLPPDYYAQAEQVVGPMGPDVLTLQTPESPANGDARSTDFTADMDDYVLKRRTIIVRHNSGDRIVALLEIESTSQERRS